MNTLPDVLRRLARLMPERVQIDTHRTYKRLLVRLEGEEHTVWSSAWEEDMDVVDAAIVQAALLNEKEITE